MERAVEEGGTAKAKAWGVGKCKETSRDSEETSLDHRGFRLDAVSRKPSWITTSEQRPISESLEDFVKCRFQASTY